MNYTHQEIERAKVLFARDIGYGQAEADDHRRGSTSEPAGADPHVTHVRSWRDYLPQAQRELGREESD